jgi:hypothetical protein
VHCDACFLARSIAPIPLELQYNRLLAAIQSPIWSGNRAAHVALTTDFVQTSPS